MHDSAAPMKSTTRIKPGDKLPIGPSVGASKESSPHNGSLPVDHSFLLHLLDIIVSPAYNGPAKLTIQMTEMQTLSERLIL